MLSDAFYQLADNLVDGLTKYEEEGYSNKHYYSSDKLLLYKAVYEYGRFYLSLLFMIICPTDVFYGRPKRAVNTYGKWMVIINRADFPRLLSDTVAVITSTLLIQRPCLPPLSMSSETKFCQATGILPSSVQDPAKLG